MNVLDQIAQANLAVASMREIWVSEGGISHFVLSKVSMDKETSQCEAVPDCETQFDFYGIYAYTKEGACYNVYDTATKSYDDARLAQTVLRALNASLPENEPRKVVRHEG